MISALCCRLLQVLRLDVEPPPEVLLGMTSDRLIRQESRKRLFWACWCIDTLVGTGVTRLLTLSRDSPEISLPVSERDFMYGSQSIAQSTAALPALMSSISLEACYIWIYMLRGRVLRHIRQSAPQPPPWESGSETQQILQSLNQWEHALPVHLQYNERNAYIHREEAQLSLFVSVHMIYQACYTDLLRVVLPGYHFPLSDAFESCPVPEVKLMQQSCLEHALQITRIIGIGLSHVTFGAFDDSICIAAAYESTKIQLLGYRHSLGQEATPSARERLVESLDINLSLMENRSFRRHGQNGFLASIFSLMQQCGLSVPAASWKTRLGVETPEESDVGRVEHERTVSHLHRMSAFRQVWDENETALDHTNQRVTNMDANKSSRQTTEPPDFNPIMDDQSPDIFWQPSPLNWEGLFPGLNPFEDDMDMIDPFGTYLYPT